MMNSVLFLGVLVKDSLTIANQVLSPSKILGFTTRISFLQCSLLGTPPSPKMELLIIL
jgi:hypothetical protein